MATRKFTIDLFTPVPWGQTDKKSLFVHLWNNLYCSVILTTDKSCCVSNFKWSDEVELINGLDLSLK